MTGPTLKPSCPQPQDWDSLQSERGLAGAFRRNLELLGCVQKEGTEKLSLSPSVGSWPPGLICHPSKGGGALGQTRVEMHMGEGHCPRDTAIVSQWRACL